MTKTFTYYDTGNVNTAADANGGLTTYKYGACGNSFLTEVDYPLGLIAHQAWDTLSWETNCAGGIMTQSTDVNGNATNFSFTDANYWRVTGVSHPDGGSTTVTYNEGTHLPWDIASTSSKDSTTNVTSDTVLDGFGRVVQQKLTSDPIQTDIVATTYDALGRLVSVTNPYRTTGDPTYGITTFAYDALGRTASVKHPDNSQLSYSYTGSATQVQDEGSGGTAHITRVYQADGMGRMVSVCEVSSTTMLGAAGTPAPCSQDIAATGFLTSYVYDALGNITTVLQPGMNNRTYSYDDLSRLLQEVNPESGTTTYTYDAAGQQGDLYQRTRPKQNQTGTATVVTTYTFDKLHRSTGRSYNDSSTPSATLSYDQASVGGVIPTNPKGNLTNAIVGTGTTAGTIFSYDPMGRINQEWQCTPVNCGTGTFSLQYSYDYLGDVTRLINGKENVTYTYSYDTAARLTKLQSSLIDANHPGTLFTVNTYNPLGEITQATLGNGIIRNLGYDNRGRLTSLADGSIYSFTLGYAGDSNILTGNDSVNGNWTYTYDPMERLSTASKTGNAFNYKYDPNGNRWQQNVTVGGGPQPQYTFDANNHIVTSGYSYDAAGNLLNDTFHAYTYDAEARLLTVDGTAAAYTYDAFGQRVRSTIGSQAHDFIFQGGAATDQITGATWDRGELFLGGLHVATYNNSVNPATTYFEHQDWVGAVRARSSVSGASVETCASLSFGDNQSCTNTDVSPLHYATLTLDSESNLQHALFRQDSTTQGRWTVPDPAGLGAVDPSNPQSWNRYTYVGSNPLSYVDPSGLVRLPCTNAGCILGSGGGECAVVDPTGQVIVTSDGLDSPCSAIDSLLSTGGVSSISGLPSSFFTPGGGTCELHGWVGEETWYECSGNIFAGSADANNGNWLQKGLDYLKNHPVFISVNEIVAGQITVQWSTKTVCANLGAGASVPPSKAVTVGVYNNGNMSNWTNVLSSWGYSFGANLIVGYQASTNSSGTIGGPTISGVGLSGSYTYGGCMTVP